jgi:guanylate kinase
MLNNLEKGLFFIVSAPAGTGKTTLVNRLEKECRNVVRSISYTTREIRHGEINGKDYFFISEDEFKKKIKNNDFLEYAKVFGHYYGTSREFVEKILNDKKHVILVIDVQGAKQFRDENIGIHIFISPPNIESLRRRLEKRAVDSKETIENRLSFAKKEMEMLKNYDYNIINDQFDVAYKELKAIIREEENRINLKGS